MASVPARTPTGSGASWKAQEGLPQTPLQARGQSQDCGQGRRGRDAALRPHPAPRQTPAPLSSELRGGPGACTHLSPQALAPRPRRPAPRRPRPDAGAGCRPHSVQLLPGAGEAAGLQCGHWAPARAGQCPGGAAPEWGGSPGVGGQHSPLKLGSVRSHVGLTKYWIKMHARMARTHSIPASAKATELRKNLRGTRAQGAPGAPPRPSALPRSFQRLPSALGT